MAQEVIWAGSSSFSTGQTPFGLYDSDSSFSSDVLEMKRLIDELKNTWKAIGNPKIEISKSEKIRFFQNRGE